MRIALATSLLLMGIWKLGTLRHGLAERNLGAVDGADDAVLVGCSMISCSAGLARYAQAPSSSIAVFFITELKKTGENFSRTPDQRRELRIR